MKNLVALLAGCLIAAPICAIEKNGPVITLTAEEDAKCKEAGGCLVIPRAELEKIVQRMLEDAYAKGLADCKSST